jgi:two-component system nitrogen regulation response regulator GlnG
MTQLRGYSWPGNIRELQSVIKQALLQATATTLLPENLSAILGKPVGPVPASPSAEEDLNLEALIRLCLASDNGDLYAQFHRRLDRLFLPRVLQATAGNQLEAARRLGIGRETLRRRLRELGLHVSLRREVKEEDQP